MNHSLMARVSRQWKRGSFALLTIVSMLGASVPSATAAATPFVVFGDWTKLFKQTVAADHPGLVVPTKSATQQSYTVDITAYTSTVEECDGDPFVTADGSDVRDGIIATNFLPFGTKVRIPELFGERVLEVHDRMNQRYWYRFDIWMNDQTAMRQFGLKRNVKIEVVEMGDGHTQWAERSRLARLAKQADKAAK